MIYSYAVSKSYAWILDIEATYHMTPVSTGLSHVTAQGNKSHIKLPNGTLAAVDNVGDL